MRPQRYLTATLLWLIATLACAQPATVAPAADSIPAVKRTIAGLYVEAKNVPALMQQSGSRFLFIDVRTRAEAVYVGVAQGMDGLAPFVEHQELMTDWDEQRQSYRLEPVQGFVAEVNRRLAEKGLNKNDLVILICRSGDRSGRAANRLAEDGFTKVYSVVDGFEGDLSGEGRRTVNGWKNAGLPWSYRLDRKTMYFSR